MRTSRPPLRRKDFNAALISAREAGFSVRSARVFPDGGFALEFTDAEIEPAAMPTDLDVELMRLEARYGEG